MSITTNNTCIGCMNTLHITDNHICIYLHIGKHVCANICSCDVDYWSALLPLLHTIIHWASYLDHLEFVEDGELFTQLYLTNGSNHYNILSAML